MLSNKEKNLVDKFKTDNIYKFNQSSWKLIPRWLLLFSDPNTQLNVILKWNILYIKNINTRISELDMIHCKVKNTSGFKLYKRQAIVIFNILNRFDIVAHTNTSLGKSLPLQANLVIEIGTIVIVLSSTVALIED